VKRVCTFCGQVVPDGAQWCPNREAGCPPGNLAGIFDYGEMLEDIQILSPWRILRLSTLYRAQRNGKPILLKVAHPTTKERLKSEARLLAKLPPHSAFLRPQSAIDGDNRPYAKTTVLGETRYYTVFNSTTGDILSEYLRQTPNPPIQYASQLITELADAVAFLTAKTGYSLLDLNPGGILVRIDKDGIPRPTILELGLASPHGELEPSWYQNYSTPGYSAPEQIRGEACTAQTDVYLLGNLFYELLAGHPAFATPSATREETKRRVLDITPTPLRQVRPELTSAINGIVAQAMDKVPARRQRNVFVFQRALHTVFGEVPKERTGFRISHRTLYIGVAVCAIILVVVCLATFLLGG